MTTKYYVQGAEVTLDALVFAGLMLPLMSEQAHTATLRQAAITTMQGLSPRMQKATTDKARYEVATLIVLFATILAAADNAVGSGATDDGKTAAVAVLDEFLDTNPTFPQEEVNALITSFINIETA